MTRWMLGPCALAAAVACASEQGNQGDAPHGTPETPSAGGASSAGGAAPVGPEPDGTGGGPGLGEKPRDGGLGEPTGCTVLATAETSLPPVRLAFALDVSGSMGKLDEEWHDPELKWKPVVAALEGFFADPASTGIRASLTFFPIDEDEDERCNADNYDTPDVPFTPLPSGAFAEAITAVTPQTQDDWIGGTPTLAITQGTLTFIRGQELEDGARPAFVLVSDGYPQGCDDDVDDIQRVVDEVAATADSIRTYVIGVSNPPGGPDTVSNLNAIAVAGRTERAFLIETGDPEKTKNDFLAAVRGIRASTLTCEFAIPTPESGVMFDAALANVTYSSGGSSEALVYDERCETEGAWRYDDAAAPTRMVLCDATCERAQADPGVQLRVEFGCTRRDVIR